MPENSTIDVITSLPNRYETFSVDAPETENHGLVAIRRIRVAEHKSGMLDQSRSFVEFSRAVFKLIEGKDYDLVFVSWETAEPHKAHDQWLLYINKQTKFVDMANLTIRDFFMPFPPNMAEGTVRYLKRNKTENGIYFPSELVIQLMSPKKEKKHVYRISFRDYRFDSYPVELLSPFSELKTYGDEKPFVAK